MNTNRLTPCRKVGLSRKRNNPLKTIETLLKENNLKKEPENLKEFESSKDSSPSLKTDGSNDTPCRKVGLSRKKGLSASLGSNNKDAILSTKTSKNLDKEKSVQSLTKKKKNEIAVTYNTDNEINIDVDKIPVSTETNGSCAKKLSNLFSEKTISLEKDDKLEVIKGRKNEESSSKLSTSDEHKPANTVPKVNSITLRKEENENKNSLTNSKEPNVSIITKKFSEGTTNSDITPKTKSSFIKVDYSDNGNCRDSKKSVNNVHMKKSKTLHESFEDDDFEIQPKIKKSKNITRSKTEVGEIKTNNEKKKFKKSLSVGDQTRNKEETKKTSSEFTNHCFVKLEPLNQSNNSVQKLSDDEFDLSTNVPKDKITCLEILEKEVNEKRKVLEELQRSKMYKKMHSVEELKKLTSRWRNGCKDALEDLLKQLNMHSHMTMTMLLKKLSIPEDFVSSQ